VAVSGLVLVDVQSVGGVDDFSIRQPRKPSVFSRSKTIIPLNHSG
jgi:hypothetical protein